LHWVLVVHPSQTFREHASRKREQPDARFFFGFNARLGRLQFFLSTIGLAVLMIAISFAILASGSVHLHVPKGSHINWDMLTWPLVCVVLFFSAASFMLPAMRVRDIGWDPVCVLGGWIAIIAIDAIVATKLPALSLPVGAVSGLVNLAMFGVLYFWPSSDAY
jgi:uncharacterized membrane protein YhaH (DUF805 family)